MIDRMEPSFSCTRPEIFFSDLPTRPITSPMTGKNRRRKSDNSGLNVIIDAMRMITVIGSRKMTSRKLIV
jgi:hypothetical protein